MNVFVARQPIFDRRQRVFAYELLFRNGLNSVLTSLAGDQATSQVLANTFWLIGIETLTRGKRAFINFTRNLLLRGIATTLPQELIAVEILENIKPDTEIIQVCRHLRDEGYLIALDDFVYKPQFRPLIDLADVIKVDFMATPVAERQRLVKDLRNGRLRFLAEKVETQDDFQMALDFGYAYIQGYFFSKPVVIAGRDIPGFKLNYLQALYEINQPVVNIDVLEQIIKQDLSLAYKLLRFINSAYFGLPHRIHSIRHALMMIGLEEVRKWASLVVLTGLGQDKPNELMVLSAIRAKFCESLAPLTGHAEQVTDLYMMGLFSLVNAFIDRPIADILQDLPLAEAAKQALLGEESPFSHIYNLMLAYEGANWERLEELAQALLIPSRQIPDLYRKSVEWANRVFYT